MALLAPMPSASVSTVTTVKTGDFISARSEWRRSNVSVPMWLSPPSVTDVAALAGALIVGVRHRDGAAQIRQRVLPRGAQAAREQQLLEIGSRGRRQIARGNRADRCAAAGAAAGSTSGRSHHASSGSSRLARTSAASA